MYVQMDIFNKETLVQFVIQVVKHVMDNHLLIA